MILEIAILSTLSWIFGILISISDADNEKVETRMITSAIAVLAWWNICISISVVLIVFGALFGILLLISNFDKIK